MQISDEMRRAAREAFKKCRPVERVACQDFGMQQDDILDQQLEAALQAALAGHVVVPISGWRDIASAPKDGERILLGFSGSMSAEGYWHDGSSNYREQDGWYFADDDVLTGRPCNPDCWQPLPIPPVSRGE